MPDVDLQGAGNLVDRIRPMMGARPRPLQWNPQTKLFPWLEVEVHEMCAAPLFAIGTIMKAPLVLPSVVSGGLDSSGVKLKMPFGLEIRGTSGQFRSCAVILYPPE